MNGARNTKVMFESHMLLYKTVCINLNDLLQQTSSLIFYSNVHLSYKQVKCIFKCKLFKIFTPKVICFNFIRASYSIF